MTAHLNSSVIDNGLSSLKSAARYVYVCSQEPTTYAEASSTYAKGNKDLGAGNVFPNAIADGTNGRKVSTAAIGDGTVSANATVTHWAICDGSNLLAVGALASGVAIATTGVWALSSFDITVKSQ